MMLCDDCHQNEAIFTFVEISGGVKRELNLCRECAAKRRGFGPTFMSITDTSFFSSLLAGMLGISDNDSQQDGEDEEDLRKTNVVCPSCGMTYDEFLKHGTFGCPDCYRTFHFLLDGYLKKMHGSSTHCGKSPLYGGESVVIPFTTEDDQQEEAAADDGRSIAITVDVSSSEEELRAALRRAVAREEYEEASRIRDMIRALKRS